MLIELSSYAASFRAMEEYDHSHSDAEREDVALLDCTCRLTKARHLTRSGTTNE